MASESTLPGDSNQSELVKMPPVMKLPPIAVRKELHTLIGTVKEMGSITTYQEVLEGLGKYIMKKKLFDERNPYKVLCKDDELGTVLGIEEFTMYNLNDLKPFLQKMAIPVNKTCINSVIKDPPVIKPAEANSLHFENPLKRKSDESTEYDKKKAAVEGHSSSPLVIHIPSSPIYIDESDSVESIQGYETAVAKDTSDDFLSADNEEILAIEETYNIEYEVDSDSSSDATLYESSDSAGEENPRTMMLLNAAIYSVLSKPESDIEFFADDSSDNDSDDDVEITESDFWTCKTCKVANKPTMRYCLKCFNERLNWLPDQKRKRKPRKAVRPNGRDTNKASSSKNDPCSSQGSNASSVSCAIKPITPDPPSSDLGSANVSYADSPSLESVSSPYMTSADLACTESSDLPCTENTPDMDTKNLPPNNNLGTSCEESVASPYFQSTEPSSMDSDLGSLPPKSSFCMKSINTCFDGLKNLSPVESLGSSSMESSGPSSLDSVWSSSMRSSGPSSLDSVCSSSMGPSGSSSVKTSCYSSKESACPSNTKNSGPSNAEPGVKVCIICYVNPALASIIHGKYAHQITCYDCARKIRKERGVCPVCRKRIERVVHQINS